MMANEKILVVEDEEDLLELLRYNLERERYHVTCATSGETALTRVKEQIPDLILLDLMLPGLDGLDVCRELKRQPSTGRIPMIFVTAKAEDVDIVSGLELGADDYITKPFSPRILVARIKAVLRGRKQKLPVTSEILKVHDLTIDAGRYEVLVSGAPVTLTASEFAILHLLARRPGWVYSRDQIIRTIKGDDYPVTDRSVDVQIVGLRKKLGKAGECIQTVRSVGYRLKETDSR
jgi:two-component system, OmpR family, alkaline phosphatase synthesis response regulator PhoP